MEEPVQEPSASVEPKQKTLKGTEIPLPKRGEVMDAFKKIVRPVRKQPD